ncbi:MAG: site-specific DNA-methyltransferase, partial [Patescibacteria group bacterium]|nr:site-specific DNA-methyltransferase [Patescibacteria group bacterium]
MNSFEKFKQLLKEIFQFDTSDLDFGIYRILNYKHQQIEKFIDQELKERVEKAFEKYKQIKLEQIEEKLIKVKEKIENTLGKNALTETGEIKDEFKKTPIGEEFIFLKSQKQEIEEINKIQNQVFNDLYTFFSRYYEEGDFVPQYRYSIKNHKYAIPYNGEEVKLYWANADQYYIKTGLLFRDYAFKAGDYRVIFQIVEAEEELGSNKATKERFFILDEENPLEVNNKEKLVIIRFQYRELTQKEVKNYDVEVGSNTSKQEKINQKIHHEILSKINKNITLKEFLTKKQKNEKELLLNQLNRFSAKNTKDYFIHKNLKKFLQEQLDYFIKAEVIDIDTLEKEKFLDKHITRLKVVREIGEVIIDFLAQIEDFQKRLWEKKKFVLKTEYVITLDKIFEYTGDENFMKEIIAEIL